MELVGRGAGDVVEPQTRRRAAGDGVEQLGLAAAELHDLEQVGVVDRQRGRATDRFDRDDRVRREGPPLRVEQIGHADHATLGDERHDELGLVAEAAQLLDLDGVASWVLERRELHRGAVGDGELDRGPLVERDDRALPLLDDLASFHAGHAEEIRPGEQVDVARRSRRDLAEAIGGRQQDVAQLEGRRELQAGVVDDRQPATGLVELPVERGVGHGLGGDLGQSLEERDAGELAGVAVVQRDQTDDFAAHDQRQADARAVARFEQDSALLGVQAVGGGAS